MRKNAMTRIALVILSFVMFTMLACEENGGSNNYRNYPTATPAYVGDMMCKNIAMWDAHKQQYYYTVVCN